MAVEVRTHCEPRSLWNWGFSFHSTSDGHHLAQLLGAALRIDQHGSRCLQPVSNLIVEKNIDALLDFERDHHRISDRFVEGARVSAAFHPDLDFVSVVHDLGTPALPHFMLDGAAANLGMGSPNWVFRQRPTCPELELGPVGNYDGNS